MDSSSLLDVIPFGLDRTRDLVSTMRFRLGFSLIVSKEGFHVGGRAVCTKRSEGERESATARGEGCPCVTGDNRPRGRMTTISYIIK
jgi:hypothetical protein